MPQGAGAARRPQLQAVSFGSGGGGFSHEEWALFFPHPHARRRQGPRQRDPGAEGRQADGRRALFLVGRLLQRR